jgi:hypothetical protein
MLIFSIQMMGAFCCGAPFVAWKLILSLPQSSVMDKGKEMKTAVFYVEPVAFCCKHGDKHYVLLTAHLNICV